ncbi:ABC transporter permease subunit [Flaviflexus huanghaiensis]|uniref:ABC transporter permease subunit n=1 Tax=Flaviflexus huanghaiensis TaxID=1111473 RepID=UPI0015F7966B|nr:ABC transporter permease subunit [Flaviflexus huanghaiensis]
MSTAVHQPTFARLIRSELRKLTSLRSTWVIAALTIAFYLLISFFVAQAVDTMIEYMSSTELAVFTGSYMVTSIFQIALLFGIAFGTVTMTAEYSHNTIQISLLSSRSRMTFYAAKIIVLAGFWAAVSALALLLSTILINLMIGRYDLSLPMDDVGFWLSLLSTVAVLVASAVMAAGLGAVLRSTVGATTTMFGIVLILPILQIIPLDFIENLTPYFPINVMMSAVAPRENGILAGIVSSGDSLSPDTALIVLLIYATIFVGLGAFSLRKRDA